MKFPGRTKQIEGSDFIHFEDYCKWPGRKVKGDLQKQIKSGIVTASWNKWIEKQGGEEKAALAGIPVGNLHDYVDQYSYYSCQGDIEEHLQKRLKFMESIRIFRNQPERQD